MRLDPLFRPESIAVIGASDKPTPGRRIIASLERIGFAGRIFPVNPNYPSVLNRPCYASPAELPDVDTASIVAFCRERLASYKVPARLAFRTASELPRTPTGKIHKPTLSHELAANIAI